MRAVLQRASRASVIVDGVEVAAFDRQGIVALVGVTHEDGPAEAALIARQLLDRIARGRFGRLADLLVLVENLGLGGARRLGL